MSMNSCDLIGRLTDNPELSYTPNTQTAVCRFTIAVNRPKRNGEDQGADFLRIVVYGRKAENCDQYLEKGRMVAVVNARVRTGSYTNREGQKVYTTDFVVAGSGDVDFLSSGNGGQRNGGQRNDGQRTGQAASASNQAPARQAEDLPGASEGDFDPPMDDGFGDFDI